VILVPQSLTSNPFSYAYLADSDANDGKGPSKFAMKCPGKNGKPCTFDDFVTWINESDHTYKITDLLGTKSSPADPFAPDVDATAKVMKAGEQALTGEYTPGRVLEGVNDVDKLFSQVAMVLHDKIIPKLPVGNQNVAKLRIALDRVYYLRRQAGMGVWKTKIEAQYPEVKPINTQARIGKDSGAPERLFFDVPEMKGRLIGSNQRALYDKIYWEILKGTDDKHKANIAAAMDAIGKVSAICE